MKRLSELRKERKVSQAELAELLHISQQAICKYELGQSEPDIYTLKGMADFFHTSVDYLVEHESNGNIESDGLEIKINHETVTRLEIAHLIAYRQLDSQYKEHIDNLINDLNNSLNAK